MREARCTVCRAVFVAGKRGPVAARCPSCQKAWRKSFDHLRPSITKAWRAEYFAAKKKAGLLKNGKVVRGRPKATRPRMGAAERNAMHLFPDDDFYRRP